MHKMELDLPLEEDTEDESWGVIELFEEDENVVQIGPSPLHGLGVLVLRNNSGLDEL